MTKLQLSHFTLFLLYLLLFYNYHWMICNLFAVAWEEDGNELINHRSNSLYNVRFSDMLVLLYSGCKLIVECSVTEA